MKHGHTLITIHSRGTKNRYRIEFWTQPWWRWVVAHIYHWYDMRIYKVPGFVQLENLLRHKEDEWDIPLSCRQDLRCFHLTNKQRTVVAAVEITVQQYKNLGGRYFDAKTSA